jgi:hypothetical protein
VSNAKHLRGSIGGLTPLERQSRRLNDEIASKTQAGEVLQICERHQAQFSAVHWVTAFHRVAKAEDSQDALATRGFA